KAAWRLRLGQKDKPRIGFAVTGGANARNDHERSMGAAAFAPLFQTHANFYCLQNDIRPADRVVLEQHANVATFADEPFDFSEAAALASELDLVISVDTSIAHLAGALGLDVWILLSQVADFRWLIGRERSPWHPTARLFRQTREGDWDGVIARVGVELDKR
ncbi:MAG: glycosyltransferase family 9 protein, partial [Hyphomonadaceae bacterium]